MIGYNEWGICSLVADDVLSYRLFIFIYCGGNYWDCFS